VCDAHTFGRIHLLPTHLCELHIRRWCVSADRSSSADTQGWCLSEVLDTVIPCRQAASIPRGPILLAGKEITSPEDSVCLPARKSRPRGSWFPCRQAGQVPGGLRLLAGKEGNVPVGPELLAGKENESLGGRDFLAGKQNASPGDVGSLPARKMGPRGMLAACRQGRSARSAHTPDLSLSPGSALR
jgi:hypothetical protein